MSQMTEIRARKILGVDARAGIDVVRAAWKLQAKRYHPDQPTGCANRFVAIGDAYTFLKGHLEEDAPDIVRPWANHQAYAGKRPRAKGRTKPTGDLRGSGYRGAMSARRDAAVNGQKRSACANLADRHSRKAAFAEAASENGGFYVDPRGIRAAAGDGSHIAETISVAAGKVRILVRGAMMAGKNSVAVPAGTRDSDKPTLIRFQVPSGGTGRIRVGEAIRKRFFPWAEDVEIAFVS